MYNILIHNNIIHLQNKRRSLFMKHLIGHKVEDFKVQAYHQGDF